MNNYGFQMNRNINIYLDEYYKSNIGGWTNNDYDTEAKKIDVQIMMSPILMDFYIGKFGIWWFDSIYEAGLKAGMGQYTTNENNGSSVYIVDGTPFSIGQWLSMGFVTIGTNHVSRDLGDGTFLLYVLSSNVPIPDINIINELDKKINDRKTRALYLREYTIGTPLLMGATIVSYNISIDDDPVSCYDIDSSLTNVLIGMENDDKLTTNSFVTDDLGNEYVISTVPITNCDKELKSITGGVSTEVINHIPIYVPLPSETSDIVLNYEFIKGYTKGVLYKMDGGSNDVKDKFIRLNKKYATLHKDAIYMYKMGISDGISGKFNNNLKLTTVNRYTSTPSVPSNINGFSGSLPTNLLLSIILPLEHASIKFGESNMMLMDLDEIRQYYGYPLVGHFEEVLLKLFNRVDDGYLTYSILVDELISIMDMDMSIDMSTLNSFNSNIMKLYNVMHNIDLSTVNANFMGSKHDLIKNIVSYMVSFGDNRFIEMDDPNILKNVYIVQEFINDLMSDNFDGTILTTGLRYLFDNIRTNSIGNLYYDRFNEILNMISVSTEYDGINNGDLLGLVNDQQTHEIDSVDNNIIGDLISSLSRG